MESKDPFPWKVPFPWRDLQWPQRYYWIKQHPVTPLSIWLGCPSYYKLSQETISLQHEQWLFTVVANKQNTTLLWNPNTYFWWIFKYRPKNFKCRHFSKYCLEGIFISGKVSFCLGTVNKSQHRYPLTTTGMGNWSNKDYFCGGCGGGENDQFLRSL